MGFLKNGEIILKEVYRFKNEMIQSPNGLVWDIPRLFHEIKIGLKKAFEEYLKKNHFLLMDGVLIMFLWMEIKTQEINQII